MSPTRNLHGYYVNKLARLLERHLPQGEVIVECAVDTEDGTKEADVVWASKERFAIIRDEFSSSIAPEICAEVMSPSNTPSEMMTKKDLYLKAGAKEYWLCDETGNVKFYDASGALNGSRFCPGFPSKVE